MVNDEYAIDDKISNVTHVILEEYRALRGELMYFLDHQRKLQQILLTVSIGQASLLMTTNLHIAAKALGLAMLFLAPLAIVTLMALQLEATSKIILIADYIHKGIRHQLKDLLGDNNRFFEWEEHKARTRRVARWLLKVLDATKWIVFIYGLIASFAIGAWLLSRGDYSRIAGTDRLFLIWAFVIDAGFLILALYISSAFNEVDGEALRAPIDNRGATPS